MFEAGPLRSHSEPVADQSSRFVFHLICDVFLFIQPKILKGHLSIWERLRKQNGPQMHFFFFANSSAGVNLPTLSRCCTAAMTTSSALCSLRSAGKKKQKKQHIWISKRKLVALLSGFEVGSSGLWAEVWLPQLTETWRLLSTSQRVFYFLGAFLAID